MSNYSGWGFDYQLKADADMDSNQWKFVGLSTSAGYFTIATGGSGPMPIGVLQDDPRSGQPGAVRVLGTTKVAASGAVGVRDFLTCASNAFAVAQASASAAVVGLALTSLSSGSGYIEALLLPAGISSADNTP